MLDTRVHNVHLLVIIFQSEDKIYLSCLSQIKKLCLFN